MSDRQLVFDAGIHFAIIVDDGYDEVPQVEELLDEDGWNSLFDDAQGGEAERIVKLFPGYDPKNWEELKANQEFVCALWQGREDIKDLLGDLFNDYEDKIQSNRSSLALVEAALNELGIRFDRCGRNFVEKAVKADLIIIDLFLGIKQDACDRQLTVDLLNETLESRDDHSLPSII